MLKNKMHYDLKTYNIIARGSVFERNSLFAKLVIIAVTANIASQGVYKDNKNVNAWILAVIAFIIAPAILFIYPMVANGKKMYKQSLKVNNGKEIETTIDFEDKSIICHNTVGQRTAYKYENVREVSDNGSVKTIRFNQGQPIYVARDGFIGGTWEDFYELMNNKCVNMRRKLKVK